MNARNQATSPVTTIILDTVASAIDLVTEFNGNYDMYCSYLGQFGTGTKKGVRHAVCIAPVSFAVLSNVEV